MPQVGDMYEAKSNLVLDNYPINLREKILIVRYDPIKHSFRINHTNVAKGYSGYYNIDGKAFLNMPKDLVLISGPSYSLTKATTQSNASVPAQCSMGASTQTSSTTYNLGDHFEVLQDIIFTTGETAYVGDDISLGIKTTLGYAFYLNGIRINYLSDAQITSLIQRKKLKNLNLKGKVAQVPVVTVPHGGTTLDDFDFDEDLDTAFDNLDPIDDDSENEPSTNDGLSHCFWCKKPTKKIYHGFGFSKPYDFCKT